MILVFFQYLHKSNVDAVGSHAMFHSCSHYFWRVTIFDAIIFHTKLFVQVLVLNEAYLTSLDAISQGINFSL